jgi:MFS family permease
LVLAPQFMALVLFSLLLIAFGMIWFSPRDHTSVHAEKKLSTHHHYIRRHFIHTTLKAIKKLNPASTMLLFLNLSANIFYGTIWFVVPLVIAHQANAGLLGVGLGMFDFAIVALGFLLGNLADRGNKRTLVFFGILIFSICGMFLGFNFGWLFLIFGFLATAGDEMAAITLWSWLHSLDHEHDSDGTVAGVISLFEDLGWAIGPMVAGILYGFIGPSWTITVAAVPIFIVWIVYQVVGHKHLPHFVTALTFAPQKPHRARHKN